MALRPGSEKRRVPLNDRSNTLPTRLVFHQNKDWFQDLVEHSQDLLCVHDLQGQLLSVDPLPARLLGYSVEEMLSTPMREMLAPEFRHEFDVYLDRIQRDRQVRGQMVVVTRSGERRIWEFFNILEGETTSTQIVRGMARDVTEQRKMESQLLEANEKLLRKVGECERTIRDLTLFRTLVDRSTDSILVVGFETLEFLDANERACSQLGYGREELLTLGVFDIDPLASKIADTVKQSVKDSGFITIESVHTRRDGSTFPVELQITGVGLDRFYLVVVARDLTAPKLYEERLVEYERLVEGMEEMIVVLDRDYRYVIANRAFLNFRSEAKKEAVIGRTLMEIVSQEALATIVPKVDECFLGKIVEFEMKHNYPKLDCGKSLFLFFPSTGLLASIG